MHTGGKADDGRSLDPYVPNVVVDWLLERPEDRVRDLDGTLVFADVSGFTPLSERLARKGKVGAEELTEILNRVFGRLLDDAYGVGGDLLKFGGDALLLLFEGDSHAERGVAAAARMQRTLKDVSRIDTGAGIVRLRMSVGVHSGPLLLFLVGTSHRELLITGPGATETVRMESAADAGEVLVSPATAARVPPSWLGDESDGGRLLRIQRAARAHPAQPFQRRGGDVGATGVPSCLRDFLLHAPSEGEHRQATLAFLQFKGLDALLAEEGSDAVADALDELVSISQEAAERHEVTFLATDVDADGGKILFSTGAPTAAANDDDRMLQALREILDRRPRLAIRAGVNRGHAFAVDVGAPYRRTFAVMGDPTNLAARVMGKAPMGGLLATQAVVDRLRDDFDLRPLEPFMVKGKSHPIHASEVGAVSGMARRRDAADLPLIGRGAEREVLALAAAAVRAGRGSLVSIVGEPGLGKSRLVAEARRVAHAPSEFVVEGGQYATLSPYFPLRAPLRGLLDAGLGDADADVAAALRDRCALDAPDLLPWLPLLAIPFGVELADTDETAAIHEDFRRAKLEDVAFDFLLRALDTPALLIIEDAHWLDDASAALLARLAEEIGDRQWLMCVTRRNEPGGFVPDPSGDDVTQLTLEPLDDDAAAELVTEALRGAPLPPDVMAKLAERSGGNPLFLSELVGAAAAGGSVDDLPDRVEPLIAARIDTLGPADRQVLREVSVLGVRFGRDLLPALTGHSLDDLDGTVRRLDGFLVRDGDAFRFRHALLREVAYESLPFRRRRALHRTAGDLLERRMVAGGERPAALLSMHFYEAQDYERSWRYAREAADAARERWAPVEAATLYGRAVASARRLDDVSAEELAAVYFEWGNAAQRAGHYDEAFAAYRSARRLWRGRPVELALLAIEEGSVMEHRGAYSDALRRYTRARSLLAADAQVAPVADASARLLVAAASARLRQGRYRQAIEVLERAVEIARSLEPTAATKQVLARAYFLLDWAYTDIGDPAAESWRELALPIYEELEDFHGQSGVLNNLGIDAYYEGRWAASLELYERARVAADRSGDAMRVAMIVNNIGEVLSDQGHLERAEDMFREAWRMWKGLDARVAAACALNNLARLETRAGRFDAAASLLAEAAHEFEATGAQTWLLEVDARRAECALFSGDAEAALELAAGVRERAGKLGAPPVLLAMIERVAGYAYSLRDDPDRASVHLQESLRVARSSGSGYEIGLTLRAIADIERRQGGDGSAEAEESTRLLDALGVVKVPEVPLLVPRPVPLPV